jgi:hypothetical protein
MNESSKVFRAGTRNSPLPPSVAAGRLDRLVDALIALLRAPEAGF